MVDWNFVNQNWGDILKKARLHADFQKEVTFDDDGRLYTTPGRPMIESMICERVEKSHRFDYYMQVLGYPVKPGRAIRIGVGNKMPMATGGKGKKA